MFGPARESAGEAGGRGRRGHRAQRRVGEAKVIKKREISLVFVVSVDSSRDSTKCRRRDLTRLVHAATSCQMARAPSAVLGKRLASRWLVHHLTPSVPGRRPEDGPAISPTTVDFQPWNSFNTIHGRDMPWSSLLDALGALALCIFDTTKPSITTLNPHPSSPCRTAAVKDKALECSMAS